MSGAATMWPASWRTVPLWSMFRRLKDLGHPDEQMLSVYREHGVVQKESRDDNFNKTAENRNIYQLVEPGWLVVNRMKAWQGALGISGYRGIVSGHYICFRPEHSEEPRFLNYLLRSSSYTTLLRQRSRGVRPNQIEIDNDWLRVLPIHLPDLHAQRAIADYLDAETARIDALIAKKRRMFELLEEHANSQILDWIGRAGLGGENQAARPIRRLLRKHERWSTGGGEIVTAFRDGDVTSREVRGRKGFTDSWTEAAKVQEVRAGEVVVHGLDGFSGAIGDAQVDGVCSPVYHVCEPIDGDGAFYGRMLRLLALDGYLGGFASSTRERAVDFRNWDMFGRIPVPDVPVSEQRRIGSSIRSIRPLRDRILASEALAREYRQALITSAVTGELDVPKAA